MNLSRSYLLSLAICLILAIGLLMSVGYNVSAGHTDIRPDPPVPILSGRVYAGSTGIEPPNSTPLQGVTVSLYCSNNYDQQGTFLRSTTTGSTGLYSLEASEICEYYNIIETDPAGYTSDGATTVGGSVITANWIQYTNPLGNKTLTGNKFWDRAPATNTPTSPPPATNTPTRTPTPTATATATASEEVDLEISKVGPNGLVSPGSIITYTVMITNTGPGSAVAVKVVDYLPSAVSFISCLASTGSCSKVDSRPPNDIVNWVLGDIMPAGRSETLLIQVRVDDSYCGVIGNGAYVSSDSPESNFENNSVHHEAAVGPCDRPAVVVRKRLVDPPAGPVSSGDVVTFAIDVFNIGDRPLHSLSLEDSFASAEFDVVMASPQPMLVMTTATETLLRWSDLTMPPTFGFGVPLQPGDSFMVLVRLRTRQPGWSTNCAVVDMVVDGVPVNSESCDSVQVILPGVDLVISKEIVSPVGGTAAVSDTVEFKISLENVGDQPIINLHLEDNYDPAYLSFQSSGIPPDDPTDDGQLVWSNIISAFGQPLMPNMTFSFSVKFHAHQPTSPQTATQNCIWAGYRHEQGPLMETPERCARLRILAEPGPAIAISKRLITPFGGVAAPGDPVGFSFVITNTGTTTLTTAALTDLYDTACLGFVPTGWPPSWHLDPDDPTNDGQLDWQNYISAWSTGMPPGGEQKTWPGVKFQAQAGPNCDPTVNRVEIDAVDAAGRHATAGDEASVSIVQESEPFHDLGDAPSGFDFVPVMQMTAYPAGVPANFPTVYIPLTPPFGPLHLHPHAGAWLGDAVSLEENAAGGFDEDGVNNIDIAADVPNRDEADDGLLDMTPFNHCQPANIVFGVTVPPGNPLDLYYFNAWFDWNRNGAWGDVMECSDGLPAEEWAVKNQVLTVGAPGQYVFTSQTFIPWNPDPGKPLWFRITLSEQRTGHSNGSGPASGYEFGETEDYYLPGEQQVTPTPTPTPRATMTPTPTPRATMTPTPTPASNLTPTPTATPQAGCCIPLYLPLVLRTHPLRVSDHFNDGDLVGWTAHNGTWANPGTFMAGQYALGNAWNMTSWMADDFVYEGTVQLKSGNAVGLTFRANADGSKSYDVILDAVDGVFKISKRPPYKVLDSYAMTVQMNRNYRIKVMARGSRIDAYLDGVKRLSVNDTTYPDGYLGVILFRSTATYDNIDLAPGP